jgi:hypothetical protein
MSEAHECMGELQKHPKLEKHRRLAKYVHTLSKEQSVQKVIHLTHYGQDSVDQAELDSRRVAGTDRDGLSIGGLVGGEVGPDLGHAHVLALVDGTVACPPATPPICNRRGCFGF